MKTIPAGTNSGSNSVNVPVPTTRHHVARVVYKVLLAAGIGVTVNGIVKSGDPVILPALILFAISLPAHLFVEWKIRQIDSWTESNRVRRGLLFSAECCIPTFLIMSVVSAPALLQAYGINPSPTAVALTSMVCASVISIGGILANRVWTLNKLGFER